MAGRAFHGEAESTVLVAMERWLATILDVRYDGVREHSGIQAAHGSVHRAGSRSAYGAGRIGEWYTLE